MPPEQPKVAASGHGRNRVGERWNGVHADECDGAIAAGRGGMAKRRLQESRESLARHLANPHGEFAMADAPEPARNGAAQRAVIDKVQAIEQELALEAATGQSFEDVAAARRPRGQ